MTIKGRVVWKNKSELSNNFMFAAEGYDINLKNEDFYGTSHYSNIITTVIS